MNAQIIFVVVAYGGQYDDSWEANTCARYARDAAEIAISEFEEQDRKLAVMAPIIQDVFYEQNNIADEPYEDVPEAPKGPARGTKEQLILHKEAVLAWQKIAFPIIQRNEERTEKVRRRAVYWARQKAIELGATESELQRLGFSEQSYYARSAYRFKDRYYRIDELELQ